MRTEIVPATGEMFARLQGPPPAVTVRAVAAVRGGDLLGVAGAYANESGWVMFSTLTDKLRADKRAMVRMMREVQRILARRRMSVVAVADPQIDGSDILLEHMGFERAYGDVYLWRN